MIDEESRIKSFTKKQTPVAKLGVHLSNYFRNLASLLLSNIRKGPETVLFIPPVARGGNWLYEWMYCYIQSEKTGNNFKVLKPQASDKWIEEFPKLNELNIEKKDVKFTSKREIGFHQDIRSLFSEDDFSGFIKENILSSSHFKEKIQKAKNIITKNTVVINIRRGDYYSNPIIHKNFGISTEEYIRKTISIVSKEKEIDKIVITSDDVEWCRINLNFLSEKYILIFPDFKKSMFDDLALLSVAHNLILTNTTFGYWGAYIAEADHATTVWVPNIHEKALDKHRAVEKPLQHKKSWNLVTPLPERTSWLESDCNEG